MLMKNHYRAIVASILIFCLLLVQLQPAHAISKKMIADEKAALEKVGIMHFVEIVDTKKVKLGQNTKTQYTVKSGEILNNIIVLENSSEKITLRIEQDDICNTLEVKNNGDIILDGKKIVIEKEASDDSGVKPLAGASIYIKDTVSYGTEGSYGHFLKNENISNIELNKLLSGIALSALLAIMGAAMTGISAYVIPFAAGAGAAIYDYLMRQNPNTTALSCKSKVYTHNSYPSGYIPSLFTFIYKYKVTYYPKANYGGKAADPEIVYKYNMQG